MPRLPVVSGQAAIRTLDRIGFVVVRQRGSHVVPLHREEKSSTLAGVPRQAGVTQDVFLAALD